MDKNSIIGWTLMAVLMILLLNTMGRMKQDQIEQEQEQQATEQVETKEDQVEQSTSEQDDQTETATKDTVSIVELSDSARQMINKNKFGVFGAHGIGTEEETVVENDVLTIIFTNKGAVPKSVILKDYVTHDQRPLEVYTNDGGGLSFKLFAKNTKYGNLNTDSLFFTPTLNKTAEGTELSYKLNGENGAYYEHKYFIPNEGFLLDFDLNMNNLQDLMAKDYFKMYWSQTMPSQEGSFQTEKMYSSVYYADKDLNVEKINYRKTGEKELKKNLRWVSFKQKFFNSSLITDAFFDADQGNSFVAAEQPGDEDDFVKKVSTELLLNYEYRSDFNFPMHFYFGPNDYKGLKELDINLQKTVQLGVSVFRWVNLYLIMPMFNFLNKFIGNYGIIILILTLFIKLIVAPFTYKSHLSMIKMRVLQPELTALREKFGKDQAKLGPAQMDLYRKAGVNPLGGCLPMLFQMPILIAMYRFFPSSLELRQSAFLWAHDLSTYDQIISWSQEIPFVSMAIGNHISLFTVLMSITSFFYTRLNSQNTPTDPSNPMAQQMKMFQYIMPFMMFFIFNRFSAALSYYYLLFNVFSIAQHLIMKKFLIDEDKIHAEIQANKTKVRKKSKWQSRMEQMMKQQEEVKKQKSKGKKR